MKALRALTLQLLLTGTACGIANADAAATQTLPAEKARVDFDLLRKSLEEAHPGLYRYSTKAQIDAMFDSAEIVVDNNQRSAQLGQFAGIRRLGPFQAPALAGLTCRSKLTAH